MADILGLRQFLRSDGFERFLVAYGNDINLLGGGGTFTGQGRNISSAKTEMDVFLDNLVAVNGTDANLVYDGSMWHTGGARVRMPKAFYVKTVGSRMYLGNLNYAGTSFRSRVLYSDDEGASNNELKWGLETGTNLVQTAQSKVVSSLNAGFDTYGLNTGDQFFILTGNNAGVYHIDSVDSDQQITLVEELKQSATGSTYWTGSNWFDVATNDSDTIKGLGANDNKLLVFKRESLHRYDTREVKQVKGAPGTTSHRSIVNIRENTYFFHDTGVYRYDGVSSFLISRPIQDWIDGISSDNYDDVVGWADGDILYMFVGDVTNTPEKIDRDNVILIYDTAAQAWSIGSLNDIIRCAHTSLESNARITYLGTSNAQVLQWDSGNADLTVPIPWEVATTWHFPGKAYNIIEFDRCEVHMKNGRGVSVYYKLYGTDRIDSQWKPLGDIVNEVTEFAFPRGIYGRGIAFKLIESSTRLSPVLTRIDVYYKTRDSRNILEQQE